MLLPALPLCHLHSTHCVSATSKPGTSAEKYQAKKNIKLLQKQMHPSENLAHPDHGQEVHPLQELLGPFPATWAVSEGDISHIH